MPPSQSRTSEQQYTHERTEGAQNPAPRNPNAPYPVVPEVPFETGIDGDWCDAPFPSAGFTVQSCWQGALKDLGETSVCAGAQGYAGEPQRGVVIVMPEADYPAEVKIWSVPTPVKVGPVRIVAATQSGVLTLKSADDSYVFTFDVSTKKFLSVVHL